MSNQLLTAVFHGKEFSGTKRLMAIAIADTVNDDGIGLYGLDAFSSHMNLSARQTQRVRDQFVAAGDLYIRLGNGRGNKTLYLFTLHQDEATIIQRLQDYFEMSPEQAALEAKVITEKRVTFSQQRVTSQDKKGDILSGKGDIVTHESGSSLFPNSSDSSIPGIPDREIENSKHFEPNSFYRVHEGRKIIVDIPGTLIMDLKTGWRGYQGCILNEDEKFKEYTILREVPVDPKPEPAASPAPATQEKPARKPSKWDALVKAIAENVFEAKTPADVAANSGRAAVLIHGDKKRRPDQIALVGYEMLRQKVSEFGEDHIKALADEMPAFVADYRANNNSSLPLDLGTFMSHWTKFRGRKIALSSATSEWVDDPEHPGAKITPAQLNRILKRKAEEAGREQQSHTAAVRIGT